MSRSDFDVVCGPSMAQRRAPRPQRSAESAAAEEEPAAPAALPTKEPAVVDKRQRR
jgi:hypothetical protein